jgi:hypothetical protein
MMTTAAGTAWAASADEAAAEALFEEGRKLMAAGDYAHACPKLAESQRLDPGSGTALNLADCYEKVGKLASSWAAFKDAETLARNTGNATRRDEAVRRAAFLEPRLSKLTILVPPALRTVTGLQVLRDGVPVGEGQWDSAIPVERGEHTLEARAPGRRTWLSTVTISGPGATTVAVPLLVEGSEDGFWRAQRIAGLVIGGAGLAAVAVSLGVGARAKSIYNDSLAHCLPNDPTKCYAEGVTLRSQAYQLGNIATPLFVAGAIGLVGGTVTFFTTPSGARLEVQPAVGPGSGSLTVRGAW